MATVYLALDQRLDREVALKVMHDNLARRRRRSSPGSGARRARPPGSATRTSSPSTTRARTAPTCSSRWSTSPDAPCATCSRAEGPLTPRAALDVFEPMLAGARRGARRRPHPPRRQARERHPPRRRPGQGRRLRPGPRRHRPPTTTNASGIAPRHGRLPLPRAGRARHRRRPLRRLRGRAGALRDAHRPQGVRRRHRRSTSRTSTCTARCRCRRRPVRTCPRGARPPRRRSPRPATPTSGRPTPATTSPRCVGRGP